MHTMQHLQHTTCNMNKGNKTVELDFPSTVTALLCCAVHQKSVRFSISV